MGAVQQVCIIESVMKKEGSPLKVKDYFTNPIHRIRQSTFLEVGFTQQHLNTFVKAFTNRFNSRSLSFTAIQEFISTFTNHNPKLSEAYQQFFLNNFSISEFGDLSLEDFVNFFTRDEGNSLDGLDQKGKKRIFSELGQLSQENLVQKSSELGVFMTEKEAAKVIRMVNWHSRGKAKGSISEESFLSILQGVIRT